MKTQKKAQLLAKMGGGSLAALVCLTGIESASALDFNFSFDTFASIIPGSVTGTVEGNYSRTD